MVCFSIVLQLDCERWFYGMGFHRHVRTDLLVVIYCTHKLDSHTTLKGSFFASKATIYVVVFRFFTNKKSKLKLGNCPVIR
jgi:hypothetical protein